MTKPHRFDRVPADRKKKRNPRDATILNAKASKKRDDRLSTRVARIEAFLKLMLPGWTHFVKRLP